MPSMRVLRDEGGHLLLLAPSCRICIFIIVFPPILSKLFEGTHAYRTAKSASTCSRLLEKRVQRTVSGLSVVSGSRVLQTLGGTANTEQLCTKTNILLGNLPVFEKAVVEPQGVSLLKQGGKDGQSGMMSS